MNRTFVAWSLVLVACGDATDAPLEPAAPTEPTEVAPAPCEDPEVCLFEGTNAFASGGSDREVEVRLPEEPIGAPVVFAWHYLNGTPIELVDWMGLQSLADAGYVVVAPRSRHLPFTEWQVDGDPASNPDVALFDALLERLTVQYAVDEDRIYATGFSAGGLFTTYLTMNRGKKLAATAPFSGGSPSYAYDSPAGDLPVLIAWGGPGDSYGGFDFAEASLDFAADLAADGHEVVTCEHSLGHWLPPGAEAQVRAFFDDHGGPDEQPWSASPDRVAAGCTLVSP